MFLMQKQKRYIDVKNKNEVTDSDWSKKCASMKTEKNTIIFDENKKKQQQRVRSPRYCNEEHNIWEDAANIKLYSNKYRIKKHQLKLFNKNVTDDRTETEECSVSHWKRVSSWAQGIKGSCS